MFSAILILLLLPITDVSRSRGMQFRPLSKWAFFVFVANFLILMQLGAKHVESPFIELGQISTVLYFLYFTVVMYAVTLVENTFVDLTARSAIKSTLHISTDSLRKPYLSLSSVITPYTFICNFLKAHPLRVVSPSPWPLYTLISLLNFTASAVLSFHGFAYAEYNLMLSLVVLILSILFLWINAIGKSMECKAGGFKCLFYVYPYGRCLDCPFLQEKLNIQLEDLSGKTKD